MKTDIALLRREYSGRPLEPSMMHHDPIQQFEKWFDEALKAEVLEANAMTLATVSESGRPSLRVVLLKGVEGGKFVFYTNYQSAKGRELLKNPYCALNFFWPELERQVRIEGIAVRVNEERATAYFKLRPRGAQIGAWASPQSAVVENREMLEQRFREMEQKFEGKEVPKPHQWGGYEVEPYLLEFWQGRPNRLHDRILYLKLDNKWVINRLAP
ncbi:MAG: pyridoxamine 5'-phosphate oxidase [Cyclobacteriaceae bacterium]|nr:pyridoxamine 5'-phosphate oxidase [Cyclobacteriaceae bacterium]MCX7636691.1 pyridoxamine 5'-phosphate oxidase [Cyclobacteriaceae bacterium]MDW8332265.1 pyridoxamine 5'-phosphate oxidase [Cyclobacteriaceae bacterium]